MSDNKIIDVEDVKHFLNDGLLGEAQFLLGTLITQRKARNTSEAIKECSNDVRLLRKKIRFFRV